MLAGAAVLVLAGCPTEPVAISVRCEPVSEPVRLDVGNLWGVGLVDGHLLASEARAAGTDTSVGMFARWFDRDFASETEAFWLGDGPARIPEPEWVAFDHRASAQVWASTGIPSPPVRESIAIYSIAPGETDFVRVSVDLPILNPWGDDPAIGDVVIGWAPSGGFTNAGASGAVGHARPAFAVTALPEACSLLPGINAMRLMIFDDLRHYVHLYGEDPCSTTRSGDSDFAHSASLVSLRDGGLGMFYRLGVARGEDRLWYSRVDADLRVLDQPPTFAGGSGQPSLDGRGYQASAAALGSGTLLYTSRNEEAAGNLCSELGLIEPDGMNQRGAPWQLRCVPPPDAYRRGLFAPHASASIEVAPLESGHAAIAYGERTNVAFADPHPVLTSEIAWEEGVFLTTIDSLGRRSSEILRVSAPESTAVINPTTPRTETSGPTADDFSVRVLTEGDEVVVVWLDRRPDAPGYYARRYVCGPTE